MPFFLGGILRRGTFAGVFAVDFDFRGSRCGWRFPTVPFLWAGDFAAVRLGVVACACPLFRGAVFDADGCRFTGFSFRRRAAAFVRLSFFLGARAFFRESGFRFLDIGLHGQPLRAGRLRVIAKGSLQRMRLDE